MLIDILSSSLSKEEKSKKVLELDPHLVAEELEKLENPDLFIDNLNLDAISTILQYTDEEFAAGILEKLDVGEAADILNEMSPDDATDIILELENKDDVLDEVDESIKILSKYDDDETGSIMTTEMITANPNESALEVFERLVHNAADLEAIDTVYVIMESNLIGIVDLKKLISAGDKKVGNIMNTNFQYALSTDLIEDTIKKIKNYDLESIAVLENSKLVGIVSLDDAMERYSDELEEDIAKFAGLTEEEDIDEGIFSSIKKRVPWLLILLILDLVVSMIISRYEALVGGIPILVSFQPVILGLSGNAGTQSLAVCIRGISNDELNGKKAFLHMFKESIIGSILGTIIGIGIFAVVLIFLNIKGGDYNVLRVSITVGLSTLVALIFSSFFGAAFPLALNKMKIDPAMASGPFITTINDCIAILIYFGLATILL